MFKRFCLLLTLVLLIGLFCVSCGESAVKSTSVGGSDLKTGYEIDDNLSIVSPQTTFKAGEDFYFSFYNNRPFGTDTIAVELIHSESGETLADGVYQVNPEYDTIADVVWFDTPGKYKISVSVGGDVRATQEVIIE